MHLVYANAKQNLLHLILVGALGKAEGKALLEDVERALPSVQRGFVLLTDLRDVTSVDADAYAFVKELMELCEERGVKKVVRVLGETEDDLGFTIMSFFHYGHNVAVVTCLNMDQALRRLSIEQEGETDRGPHAA